ncbi:MAG: hypothetical protein EZS28_027094, partial [Streblomastix strix]
QICIVNGTIIRWLLRRSTSEHWTFEQRSEKIRYSISTYNSYFYKRSILVKHNVLHIFDPIAYDGNVCQNGTCIKGNSHYVSNDTIAMEVNMNLPIRTVHLFINGKQQPVFMSGLPSEIRIDFYIETVGETLTLISLDYLEKPTIVKLTDEIEAKWEI